MVGVDVRAGAGVGVGAGRLVPVFNVQCVMCGRAAGQILNGVFLPAPGRRPPVADKGGSRCGECRGNLYLEPDASITPFMAAEMAAQRAAARARESALRAA